MLLPLVCLLLASGAAALSARYSPARLIPARPVDDAAQNAMRA